MNNTEARLRTQLLMERAKNKELQRRLKQSQQSVLSSKRTCVKTNCTKPIK